MMMAVELRNELRNLIKSIFLLLVVLAIPCYSLAQTFSPEEQHELDSLKAIISNHNSHDTTLAAAYLNLSGILYISNIDTMIPLCEKAKFIAENALATNPSTPVKNSLLRSLAGAISNIGYIYLFYSDNDKQKGMEYLLKSLEITEEVGDKKGIATGLNNLGYIYNDQGNIEKALEFYHRSLKLEEEIGNKPGIATSLNNIGFIYDNQGDIENALEFYQKSLKLLEELGNKKGIASSFNNIGNIYQKKGDYVKALEYHHKSLKIRAEIGNKQGMATSFNNIGKTNYNNGDIDKALEFYNKSLIIHEEIGDKDGIANSLNGIASVELKKGNVRLAKKIANRSLELAKELGFPKNIKIAAELLSEIYEKENNGIQALKMYKLYILMRDSINNEETQKAIVQQQAKYKYEKQKVIDDSENQKQLAIEKEENEKQQIITYVTVCGLVLVVVFSFFVFSRLKITERQKDVIESQKEEVETAHYQLEEKNEKLEDLNREKDGMVNIVAHDLKSPFSKIKGFTQLISMVGNINEEQKDYVSQINKIIAEGDFLIRDLLDINYYESHDSVIEFNEFKLNGFILAFLEGYKQELDMKNQNLSFNIKPEDLTIISNKDLLSRILDNLLTNAIKFCERGKTIEFSIWEENKNINFAVKDEGPGISEEDQKKMFKKFQKLSARPTGGESSNGLGLSIVKVLVDKLGGHIEVNSQIGKGSKFTIKLSSTNSNLLAS